MRHRKRTKPLDRKLALGKQFGNYSGRKLIQKKLGLLPFNLKQPRQIFYTIMVSHSSTHPR